MSHTTRTFTSNLHRPSASNSHNALHPPGQSPALLARVNEKKIELENLKQLRDLSGELARQMQNLEEKLATLADGTEAVAAVLANWHNVLRAIHMASVKIPANTPKTEDSQDDGTVREGDADVQLPQTLVRIPVGEVPLQPEGRGSTGSAN